MQGPYGASQRGKASITTRLDLMGAITSHCIYIRTYVQTPLWLWHWSCMHQVYSMCMSVRMCLCGFCVGHTVDLCTKKTACCSTYSELHTYIQSTSELRVLLHYEHIAGVCYRVHNSVVHSWTDSKCLCSTEDSCIGLLYCFLRCCEHMYMCVFCNVSLTLNIVATCKLIITSVLCIP